MQNTNKIYKLKIYKFESKVYRGHAEQLYHCHGYFLHKSCKEIWDHWYYTRGLVSVYYTDVKSDG